MRLAFLKLLGFVCSLVFTTSNGITRLWVKEQPKAPDNASEKAARELSSLRLS